MSDSTVALLALAAFARAAVPDSTPRVAVAGDPRARIAIGSVSPTIRVRSTR
jgi:hypothetical protein